MFKTYNIFISHSWVYSDAYEHLLFLIRERPYFTFKDFSIKPDDPLYNISDKKLLYKAIKEQMQPCHVVLILAGVYASFGKWIDMEMKIARTEFTNPKPVIAVSPWGALNNSAIAKENVDLIVGWNTDSIIYGIKQAAGQYQLSNV